MAQAHGKGAYNIAAGALSGNDRAEGASARQHWG